MFDLYAPFIDALIVLALVVLLTLGVSAEWVLGIYLVMEVVSKICKGIVNVLDPIVTALRRLHG